MLTVSSSRGRHNINSHLAAVPEILNFILSHYYPDFTLLRQKSIVLVTPSPLIPLPLIKGKGEDIEKRGEAPLKHPIKFWEGDTGDRVTILKGTKTLIYFVVNPTLK